MNRREFLGRIGLTAGGLIILQSGCAIKSEHPSAAARPGNSTVDEFAAPPFDCGPWVYWFWLDSNVTREGITADLEAMKAVGIAGVLIMDVDEGTPASFNGSKFGDAQWYDLFKFACEEANRLGIEVNMTNDAGWCGSGGPWMTPELSMQVVVWSTASVTGGQGVQTQLQQPESRMGFYRDIAVLAFPTPSGEEKGQNYRIADLHGLAEGGNARQGAQDNIPTRIDWETVHANQVVQKSAILDVTSKMDNHGVLRCDLPPGGWTILRFGHTTTGINNHPAPAGGLGLETDKLSREATLFQFEALMGRIVKNIGPLTGKTLVATHIDSWEIGVQNWTPTMRSDFKRLRGYDLLPFSPVLTGRVVESLEISERFLWDFRNTIGDLLLENYAIAMRDVAARHGLRLSIEGYSGEPANNLRYGGVAVEPMSECWSWSRFGAKETVTEMVSAGHVYGHDIIGQETFTANSEERWLGHPAVVKDIGDWTFAEGINRFVFHRYAMQPWMNPHYGPGMSMGPWGLHYERTQTWWYMSKPWHDYVARCQYMLRKGRFAADICYMQPEGSPRSFTPPEGKGNLSRRPGYNFDACPGELVIESMEFENDFLTLPGGMRYRVLVLPDSPTMTPELLRKIKKLVDAGATVVGPKPGKSPSLTNYPQCDEEVRQLADELWAGKIISGKTAEEVLAERNIQPDFECDQPMIRWIHRCTDDMHIYFVANGAVEDKYPYAGSPMVANCSFREGGQPEIWDPETGRTSPVALYQTSNGITQIPLILPAKAAVFVIFRNHQPTPPAHVVRSVSRDGKVLLLAGSRQSRPGVEILSANYGKPGEREHMRDATDDVRKLVQGGSSSFPVVKVAEIGGDPDLNVVKTLKIHCRVNGHEQHLEFHDGDTVEFSLTGEMPPVTVKAAQDGTAQLCATQPGEYQCLLLPPDAPLSETPDSGGEKVTISVPTVPVPIQIQGPWTVTFPDGWGAPPQIQLDPLIPLNEHSDAGVRYFSGTATYRCEFAIAAEVFGDVRRIKLDLGAVEVMADVTLNGQSLGILWKSPFEMDVTSVLRKGRNSIEIKVANLWVNRLIGDQQLPGDSERNPNGTLKSWPQWLLDGKPSPTGRFAFTTWELWHKDHPLVPSGLIGPVRLVTTVCSRI